MATRNGRIAVSSFPTETDAGDAAPVRTPERRVVCSAGFMLCLLDRMKPDTERGSPSDEGIDDTFVSAGSRASRASTSSPPAASIRASILASRSLATARAGSLP
jgi:hypothetical protein